MAKKRVRLDEPEEAPKKSKRERLSDQPTPPSTVQGTVCTFCEHVYVYPCNGENPQCMNAKWIREKQKGKRKK